MVSLVKLGRGADGEAGLDGRGAYGDFVLGFLALLAPLEDSHAYVAEHEREEHEERHVAAEVEREAESDEEERGSRHASLVAQPREHTDPGCHQQRTGHGPDPGAEIEDALADHAGRK